MECYVHSGIEPVGACTSCGRNICDECAVDVQGRLVCRNCLAVSVPISSEKDPNTVFLIELIAGFFGFLGVGYLYVGRSNEGIIRLILWLLYDVIAAIIISLLIPTLIGPFCCIPIQLIIQIGIPLWSANALKKDLLNGDMV